jgi:hypothetical protein
MPDVATKTLPVTFSERDKKQLRLTAALRGTSMSEVIRDCVRKLPAVT